MNKENNNRLKELIEYIEKHLEEKIEYKKLAQILLVNEYTLHRIFYFVTDISLADYVRKRRLSKAAVELLETENKIIDVAVKYQYDSETSFARAFKNMMGFTPKDIRKNQKDIKYFPILKFDDIDEEVKEIAFQKMENINFQLYTIYQKTTMQKLPTMIKEYWKETIQNNKEITFTEKSYGLVEYNKNFYNSETEVTYYIGSTEKFKNSKEYTIDNKKFLVFQIDTIEGDRIHKFTKDIYEKVLPYVGYNLDDVPDIEEYIEDKITKIYIPIK